MAVTSTEHSAEAAVKNATSNDYSTFDVGCNFATKAYRDPLKLETTIERAFASGVRKMVSISNSPREWDTNRALCVRYKKMYFTLGCHPHNAKEMTSEHWETLESMLAERNPNCVAIGECGLDYNRMFSPQEVQAEVFSRQIDLARRFDLPLYLHCRDAYPDFVHVLKGEGYFRGLVHCFTGSLDHAQELIDMGFYIGVTGWLLDKRRNHSLVDAIQHVPLERLVVETDAPWLSINRKRESVPEDTAVIVKEIARLKNLDEVACGVELYNNSHVLFGLPLGSEHAEKS
eukprot:CAMPEP_0184658250 /NCGR_PEP_ID=MMETSP0308-20130426/24456_1 /TAXON_ID=38269 /ORGANISM="Gloeochaete witrockiana, Strain SAG 46.84" /LENGTH=287 /DNA_ID=CAMNT_0027097079 /DNA_START=124 /DNA_END=987 /DNA_ORIENTATION=+